MQAIIKLVLTVILTLNLTQAFGQRYHDHTVYFDNMDGFTGYVKFKTLYGVSWPPQVTANSGAMVITGYDATEEEITALNKGGLDLRRYQGNFSPNKFSFEVTGRAYIVTFANHRAINDSKFKISQGLGDISHPDFDETASQAAKKWNENNKENYWERLGGFRAEKVTAIYLSDLKNDIDRILADYRSGMRAFDAAINSGTSSANSFNFEVAENSLADAKERSIGSNEHRTKISGLEKLIADKRKEKADQDKKEQEELAAKEEAERKAKEEVEKKDKEEQKDKKEGQSEKEESDSSDTTTKGTTSKTSGSKNDSKEESKEEDKSDSKSSKKVYIPKTATQMHHEMKEMAARTPGMMNDPNFRQRLRYLEVDANREQQTMRDYRAGVQYANNATIAQYNASNQRIDTYTKAVGDITDAATELANSIIAAGEEKKRREQAERDAAHQRKLQVNENNKNYIDAVFKERIGYIDRIIDRIKESYNSYNSIHTSPLSFKAKSTTFGKEYEDEEYTLVSRKSYLVANDSGKFGLLDDNGSIIYPPQFDIAFIVRNDQDNKFGRNYIAVMAENRWGLLYANGEVAVEMEYDHIYFLPDYNLIFKDRNQYIFIPNGELIINGQTIAEGQKISSSEIKKYFPEGIIPSSAIINKKLYGEDSNSWYDANLTYNHSYSKDGITSLMDLNGKTIWPKIPKAQNTDNINLYTALRAIEDLNYYRIKDTWYAVTENNNSIQISPTGQQEFAVFNMGVGTSIIDRKEKVLASVKWHILAPFGEEGLAPVQEKGYTNKQSEIVIPLYKFTKQTYNPYMGAFKYGYAVVQTGYGNTFNAIDTKGEKVFAKDGRSGHSVYYMLGWYFSNGNEKFPQDKAKALDYYLKAADMGSGDAMNNIGVMHMQGDYLAYDVGEAVKWYKKAAESGNNIAAKNLGFHYKESDVIESIKWFEQAAGSYPDAQYELAILYYNNDKVRNRAKAVDWFKKVVNNTKYDSEKIANANYYIGEVYEYQSNSELRKSAKDHFTKAAQGGHRIARAKLEKKVKNNEIASFEVDKNNDVHLVSIVSYDFKNNVLNGPFTWYYQNGNVQYSSNFKNGKEENKYVAYYEDGTIKEAGLMKIGKRIGAWNEYDRQGNMTIKEYNKDGELVVKPTNISIDNPNISDTETYMSVRIEPSPPMEKSEFLNWISGNYRIPDAALKAQVKGTIKVSFMVGIDGSLENIQVVDDLGYGTGEELVKVLQLSEKWEPGILNGRPVPTSYIIPLHIR